MKPATFLTFLLLATLLTGCSNRNLIQGKPLRFWLEIMQADDAAQRLQAVQVLSDQVRQAAAARRISDPQIIKALTLALQDRQGDIRLNAALTLAWIGNDAGLTVPVLLEAMRDDGIASLHQSLDLALAHHSRTIETSLAFVLQLLERRLPELEPVSVTPGGPRTALQIQQAQAAALAKLKDPSDAAVLAALEDVGRWGQIAPAGVITPVTELLARGTPGLRAAAAAQLGRLGTAAYPAIFQLYHLIKNDPDPVVRAAATAAVMRIDPQTATTINVVLLKLNDGDANVRTAAARALSEIGPAAKEIKEPVSAELLKSIIWPLNLALRVIEPAIPPLHQALRDGDPRVRAAAATTLGHICPHPEKTTPALLDALADPEPEVRAAAAWALGELPARGKPVAERLKGLLQDAQPAVRGAALLALVRIVPNDAAALPVIEGAVSDPAPDVQWALLRALGEIAPANLFANRKLAEALLALLRDPDPRMRAAAAHVLGRADLHLDRAVQELSRSLEDKAPEVTVTAAEALGWMGPAADHAAPALEKLMRKNVRPSRIGAALALGWINHHTTDTFHGLLQEMRTPEYWQLGGAAAADQPTTGSEAGLWQAPPAPWKESILMLGWKGPEAWAAAPVLAGLLKDLRNPGQVRLLAGMALVSLSSQTLPTQIPPLFRQVRRHYHQRQVQAATGLIWLGEKAAPALPELVRLLQLQGGSPELRVAAAAVIGKMGTAAANAVPALCDLLRQEDDPRIKTAVAAVLGGLGLAGKTATPSLITALKDADAGVRVAAALALGKFKLDGPFAVPALTAALADGEPRVRLAAALALGSYGPAARDAQAALQALSGSDVDPLVRRAAGGSIKKINATES